VALSPFLFLKQDIFESGLLMLWSGKLAVIGWLA
jgi:hypothetical protein